MSEYDVNHLNTTDEEDDGVEALEKIARWLFIIAVFAVAGAK